MEQVEESLLSLYLLGPPRVVRDGEPIELNARKGIALLAYLAVTKERHRRDALVNLLWPESDQVRGRTALRSTLYALRHALAGDWLDADRESVGLATDVDNPALVDQGLGTGSAIASASAFWLDMDQFHAQLKACHGHGHLPSGVCPGCLVPLTAAVNVYRGDFMSGFTLKDSFNFDDWQFFQTEGLRREFSDALDRLVQCHIAQGAFEPATRYARQWLALDRLNEAAHRQLMHLYAWAGQRSIALRQFEECARILQSQLGTSPQQATIELHDMIVDGRIPQPSVDGRAPPLPATREGAGVVQDRAPSPTDARPSFAESALPVADVTKRMVVVLSAKIGPSPSGTSRTDPEDQALLTVRLHSVIRDILSSYGGKIGRMVGGNVVALLGLGQTRESDPELAIRAAIETRREAERLGFTLTAGVAIGEIYVGASSSDEEREPTLAGSAIDCATRLAEQAQAGQILVGEATYHLAHGAFEWHPMSSDTAENGRTATTYRVERLLVHPAKARGIEGMRAALVGRNEELSRLTDALAQVLQGQGHMVSLIGEAGVGKSRLVAELRQVALRHRKVDPSPLWLEGRCLDLGTAPSYAPFVDILQSLWGWSAREADRRRYERITLFLKELVGQGHLSQERADEVAALLGRLLSLPIGPEWEARLGQDDPEQIRWHTFLAIRDFFRALCQRQPVVLVFEDLHWADSLSLDLISLLMEHLDTVPLLLLCVYRPVREHRCWHLATIAAQKCQGNLVELYLRELTREQSWQMVSALLVSHTLPLPVRNLIMDQSQGNPFFIEEVVCSLIDSGAVCQEGNAWHVGQKATSLTIPESIQSVILSRIDCLDERLQRVLKAASVVGRVFRLRVLAHTLGQEPELENMLWDLEDRALIYRERTVPEIEYSFKHVLTQQTVYQSILQDRRAGLHRQVVSAIESLYRDSLDEYYEQLAHHCEQDGDVNQTIAYLFKAGEKAKRSYANVEAIAHLTRALELLGTTPETPERDRLEVNLQLALGVPLVHVQGHAHPRVQRVYSRALELCVQVCDAPQRLQAWVGLRRFHLLRGEFQRAYELSVEILGLAQEAGDPLHISWAHAMQGEALYWLGEFKEAREHLARGFELCEALPRRAHVAVYGNDARVVCLLLGALATWHLGYPDQALAMSREGLDEAEALSYPFVQVFALYFAGMLHWLRLEAYAARAMVDAMMPISVARGFPLFTAWGNVLWGWTSSQQSLESPQGQVDSGIDQIQEGIAAWRASGAAMALPSSLTALAQAFARMGKTEEALRLLDEALAVADKNSEHCWEAELYRLKGELTLAQSASGPGTTGFLQRAEACFQQAIDVARRQNAKSWELRATTSLAKLWYTQGRSSQARALLQGIYIWFTEGFDTADLVEARTLLAAIS